MRGAEANCRHATDRRLRTREAESQLPSLVSHASSTAPQLHKLACRTERDVYLLTPRGFGKLSDPPIVRIAPIFPLRDVGQRLSFTTARGSCTRHDEVPVGRAPGA